jgi:hypothetical protein
MFLQFCLQPLNFRGFKFRILYFLMISQYQLQIVRNKYLFSLFLKNIVFLHSIRSNVVRISQTDGYI